MSGQDTPGHETGPHGRIQGLRNWVARAAEVLSGGQVSVGSYRPDVHGPLVEFDGLPGYEEVDRYWVNAPYAFVSLNYSHDEDAYRYHVAEPELDELEAALLDRLVEDVRQPLLYRADVATDAEAALAEEMATRLAEYGVDISQESVFRLYYYLHRRFHGFSKIDPIMSDPHVEDISCDGPGLPLFVYHEEYTDVETNVTFGEEALNSFVVQLAQRSGQHVSVSDPVASATLPGGSRIELALGEEVTPRGSAFTIRKYADKPFTPVDLLEYGTVSLEMLAYLWLCIENNKSLIFAGGTAAGKTTSLNAVSMFIPPRSKVLSIEDTRELSLFHDNWLSSVTRDRLDEDDISMYDLLRSALRHRPEYIIVGEVRGEEAITLFQAMNTGHTTFSTMHADSVQTVINRLENEPINVPRPMVQSLDVLAVQVLTRSAGERVRRMKTVAEIEGIDQRTGELDYSNAYSWRPSDDQFRDRGSDLLDEIRQERGWSESELQRELRDRKRFLQYLREDGVTDYRRFTAMVNKYYADPEEVMDTIAEAGVER
ncbi:MAG: type II/IV secretion system ATPase subunit [Halorientalis sp.]